MKVIKVWVHDPERVPCGAFYDLDPPFLGLYSLGQRPIIVLTNILRMVGQ